ncbi:uncharacterized protein LOC143318762 isoform X2 [Chaetodon auriga]|uniref:uncharacterized protein LOC143318762 isoform X2 n=1 Tax=Chaetodon auriga TaxID=39042 RepID=UPI004032948D
MMEMWLKRSTLVFLTAVAAMEVSGQTSVILNETRSRVSVPFGSSLTFHCDLRTQKHMDRLRVQWYFNPYESSFNESHKLPFNESAWTSTNNTTQILWNYTLPNATEKHRGWYFCKVKVEIPTLSSSDSNGTYVDITPPSPGPNLDWWPWITLGVSAVILIVPLAVCALMRRRCRRSRAEDPVYANTRPVGKQPSPRPGMPADNLKMVSSSQNLRNPNAGTRYDEGKRRYRE